MDYKIIAPNENYTGESAGVHFVNGVGIAKDGKSIDWFREKGYEVIEIKGTEPKAEPEAEQEPEPEPEVKQEGHEVKSIKEAKPKTVKE